jgi:hypothetical protein
MTDWNLAGMTQEQQDAIAERIASVLCERKKVGAERRRLRGELVGRQDQTNLSGLSKVDDMTGHSEIVSQAISAIHRHEVAGVSPELRERTDRRMEEINAAYQALKKPGQGL